MDDWIKNNARYLTSRPLKLEPCRVWRSFLGGKLLDEWRGDSPGKDTHFPEDWLGSTVKARNVGREKYDKEGYSYVTVTAGNGKHKILLKDLIEYMPNQILGEKHVKNIGNDLGMLAKLVDSAQRLTIQVHPKQDSAKRYFNYPSGKTEAWYIVKTRNINGIKPYVLLGFKKGITREKWMDVYKTQNIVEMINLMHKIPVQPGDMILVESGTPHAMGEGSLFVEIQEPCDITFRTEKTTPTGKPLDDNICSCGIGVDLMMDQFEYAGLSLDEIKQKTFIKPRKIASDTYWIVDELIGNKQTDRFSLKRLQCYKTEFDYSPNSCVVFLVNKGSGCVKYSTGSTNLRQGEVYMLPVNVNNTTWQSSENLEILMCYPGSIFE